MLGRGGALEASIEASHALLTADEQELFRRLSVFAGPFGLEDAERVGGGDGLDRDAVLDLLVALTEHSMVQAEGGSPRRFRMLEALRDHGRARLDDRAAAAAARRHATHFAQLARHDRERGRPPRAEAVGDPLVPYHWDIDAASAGRSRTRRPTSRSISPRARARSTTWSARSRSAASGSTRRSRSAAVTRPKRIQAMRWQIALLLCELRLPGRPPRSARRAS